MPRVEVFNDRSGEWRWHVKNKGRITATSGESFASKQNARRAWKAFERSIRFSPTASLIVTVVD